MKKYYQYTIPVSQTSDKEILIAFLAAAGFEGFEDQPMKLIAVSDKKEPDENIRELLKHYEYTVEELPDVNWNKEWESNFHPVILEGFCTIRAAFHEIEVNTPYEILITPQMSFGTGHHATTWLMMNQMKHIDFTGKSVLDYGTGTGVLAILAEKLGAEKITAIDIDEWSIENSGENISGNNALKIEILKGNIDSLNQQFDIILANINLNVLLDNMAEIRNKLLPGGIVVFSGILEGDFKAMSEAMKTAGIHPAAQEVKEGWGLVIGEG